MSKRTDKNIITEGCEILAVVQEAGRGICVEKQVRMFKKEY